MRELNKRGAEWVVVTQGKEPAWVTSSEGIHRLHPPEAAVVNPIGCGDCLAAGIAWGLSEKREPLDAFRIGMGAAADNLSQLLPARIDRERVLEFADRVDVTAIV
jgi:fructose-1-phosphate kinase PfkB-like protein